MTQNQKANEKKADEKNEKNGNYETAPSRSRHGLNGCKAFSFTFAFGGAAG